MKIQYNGTGAVDIPGHDEVLPGQIVEVDDAVGESLLTAGTSYPTKGKAVPPADPLWSIPSKKAAPADESPAVAKKAN